MPIFQKPKSASLNPDKLPNKKVYERDKARVKSGTPSASSKTDADTFTSLTDKLEELKNELIKIVDLTSNYKSIGAGNLSYGNVLNLFSQISKLLTKLKSSNITTTEQITLQEYADEITNLYVPLKEDADYEKDELQNDLSASGGEYTPEIENRRRLVNFVKTLITPLNNFLSIINSKLVSVGNDANRKVAIEVSGINAPPVIEGAGFKTSWKLEKGAIQYQNQKYI